MIESNREYKFSFMRLKKSGFSPKIYFWESVFNLFLNVLFHSILKCMFLWNPNTLFSRFLNSPEAFVHSWTWHIKFFRQISRVLTWIQINRLFQKFYIQSRLSSSASLVGNVTISLFKLFRLQLACTNLPCILILWTNVFKCLHSRNTYFESHTVSNNENIFKGITLHGVKLRDAEL